MSTDVQQVHFLGIDVESFTKCALLQALKRKKETVAVADRGAYHEDRHCSLVWVDTIMTEAEMDAWVYSLKGLEILGVFERKNYTKSEGYLFERLDAAPIEAPDFISSKLAHLRPVSED